MKNFGLICLGTLLGFLIFYIFKPSNSLDVDLKEIKRSEDSLKNVISERNDSILLINSELDFIKEWKDSVKIVLKNKPSEDYFAIKKYYEKLYNNIDTASSSNDIRFMSEFFSKGNGD